MSSESSDSLSDWFLVEHEKKSIEEDSGGKEQIPQQSDGLNLEPSMTEYTPQEKCYGLDCKDAILKDDKDVIVSSGDSEPTTQSEVEPVKQEHDQSEKFFTESDPLVDDRNETLGKPVAEEQIEHENINITKHKKKNSSSSDISIIDESMVPFIQDSVNNKELAPPVIGKSVLPFIHHGLDNNAAVAIRFPSFSIVPEPPPVPSKRHHKRKCNTPPSSAIDQEINFFDQEINFNRNKHVFCFLAVGVAAMLIVHVFHPYNSFWDVGKIHTSLLVCLGKQNLEALRNEKTELTLSPICHNESKEWKDVEELLKYDELLTVLSKVQKLLSENESADLYYIFWQDIRHINMKLIIHHLEHYQILPKLLSPESHYKEASYKLRAPEEEALLTQMHLAVKNLSILNEDLHSHVKIITSPQNNSLLAVLSESTQAATKNTSRALSSLEEKVKILVAQNEELKTEIHNLKFAPVKEDVVLNQKRAFQATDATSKFNIGQMEMSSAEAVNVARQVVLLQDSLEEKFQNLLKFMQELKSELKFVFPSLGKGKETENSKWSWDNMKEVVEKYFQEKHSGIKETVNSYKNINFTETLNGYVEDSKKHAEKTLRLITQFVKATRKKTKEMLDENVSDIDVEKTVNGVWNMWGAIQNKWSDIKHRFDDLTGNIPPSAVPKSSKAKYEKEDGKTAGPSGNGIFPRKPASEEDGISNRNWFLKRAALRENQRSVSLPLNWYLRRELYRERIRKLQEKKKCSQCEI